MHLLSVNYHYFRENKPENGIYPLTLTEFSKQLDLLGKNYNFISQEDLIEARCDHNSNKNSCLLTFDDGLKEQMQIFDLLNKKGIPAVFYITTDAIENSSVVDVHKIHFIRSILSDSTLLKELDSFYPIPYSQLDPKLLARQYRYDDEDARILKYVLNFIMDSALKTEFINTIFLELVGCEKKFSKDLYMCPSDLNRLNDSGCLGTHSASHRPLGTLTEADAKADIERSIKYLAATVSNKPVSISYPYGGPTAVPKLTDDYLESIGLKFGLTMNRGINEIDSEMSLFRLNRVDTNDALGGKSFKPEYFI